MTSNVILKVRDLKVTFKTDDAVHEVLHGVSFDVKEGRTLGLVGESGSGKSVTAMAIMGLLPKPYGNITQGQILYRDQDLLTLPAKDRYAMRGNKISIIFQDPMTALNPVQTIGQQLEEVLILHHPEMTKTERWNYLLEMLEKVQIPMPEKRLKEYPHNLSGGMRQRVMIAMALACHPDILICDEPTTALDVTVQARILELINELQATLGTSVIFITHDLGVVAEMCDDVAVMYQGKIREYADVFTLFDNPQDPYTKRLMSLMPGEHQTPKTFINIPTLDNEENNSLEDRND